MFRKIAAPLLLLLAALPATAAEGTSGDFEIGLYAGFGLVDSYGALDPRDDVLTGARLGYFVTRALSLELGLQRFGSTTQSGAGFDIDSVRLNLLYNFRPQSTFRPYVTLGAGVEKTDVQGAFAGDDPGLNLGGGLRWIVSPHFGLRLDARIVATDVGPPVDGRQNNFETSYGVLWVIGGEGPADTDGDGVRDRRDGCRGTSSGAVVDERGCPVDSDGDGVPDGLDRCPDTPRGFPSDADGCPVDTDGDQVPDGADACAGTPSGATVDAEGCPMDTDGDYVPDGLDRCPETPRGATVDSQGCSRDTDGDGVLDGLDACPGTPAGVVVDSRGCPRDSDGDGVYDGLDQCPETPRSVKVVDSRGCEIPQDD